MTVIRVAKILGSKRAIFSLALILFLTSTAFAVTSSILLAVDNTASSMLGESRETVVVSQINSRAPFLGTLPLSLAQSLERVPGVRVVSPEVFAPSTLSGRPVMVRGVDPPLFMELQNPLMLEGNAIAANGTSQAMVGETLAKQMGLHPGSQITVVGGVRATIVELTVEGVFVTNTPLDNEILALLSVGEWLRGVNYGVVSILRIGIDPQASPSQVAAAVQGAASGQAASSPGSGGQQTIDEYLPSSAGSNNFAGHVVGASPDVSATFFSKTVGLSQENMLLVSALVFLSMSVAIVCALQEAVYRARNEFGTLRTIGMSSIALSVDLIVVVLAVSLAAGLGGLLLGWGFLSVMARVSPIEIAFYAVDPRVAFLTASTYSLIVVAAAGLAAAAFSSLRFRRSTVVYEMTLPYVETDLDAK